MQSGKRLAVTAAIAAVVTLSSSRLCAVASAAQATPPTTPSVAIEKVSDEARIYLAPVDKVFLGSAQVAAMKWNVTHSDKDTYTVSWKTGANMRTNMGFELSAVCMELPNGRTKVQVHPQKRPTGQLFSWGEGGRIARTFFTELEKRLREMELLPPLENQDKK